MNRLYLTLPPFPLPYFTPTPACPNSYHKSSLCPASSFPILPCLAEFKPTILIHPCLHCPTLPIHPASLCPEPFWPNPTAFIHQMPPRSTLPYLTLPLPHPASICLALPHCAFLLYMPCLTPPQPIVPFLTLPYLASCCISSTTY